MDQLAEIPVQADISRMRACSTFTSFCWKKAFKLDGADGVRYMYHDPCHSPMKTHNPLKVVSELMAVEPCRWRISCCGESGTFAISRPDIATQVRFRKEQELRAGADAVRADGFSRRGQGVDLLSRVFAGFAAAIATTSRPSLTTSWWKWPSIILGENWMADYVRKPPTTAVLSVCWCNSSKQT
jgi:hypothetical protein